MIVIIPPRVREALPTKNEINFKPKEMSYKRLIEEPAPAFPYEKDQIIDGIDVLPLSPTE